MLGSNSPVERIPHEQAMGQPFQDMARRRPDLRKLERLTGFRPAIPLDRIIRDVAASRGGRVGGGEPMPVRA